MAKKGSGRRIEGKRLAFLRCQRLGLLEPVPEVVRSSGALWRKKNVQTGEKFAFKIDNVGSDKTFALSIVVN